MRGFLLSGWAVLLIGTILAPGVVADDPLSNPEAPQTLSLEPTGSAILVSWSPPAAGSVSSYVVQRLTSAGLAPPIEVDASTTQVLDSLDLTGIVGAAYQVTAMQPDGGQASISGAIIFVGRALGLDCTSIQIGTMGIVLDGPCLINTSTSLLPDPPQADVRSQLFLAWGLVDPTLGELFDIVNGIIAILGGGVQSPGVAL